MNGWPVELSFSRRAAAIPSAPESVPQNGAHPTGGITALPTPTPFLKKKGVMPGISIAVGFFITVLIIIIILITRRVRRTRIEAEMAAEALEVGSDPKKDHKGGIHGREVGRVTSDEDPFAESGSVRTQSWEGGMDHIVEEHRSEPSGGDESLRSRPSVAGSVEDVIRAGQGGNNERPPEQEALPEPTSRQSPRSSMSIGSRHSLASTQERREDNLVFSTPSTPVSKSRQEYESTPSRQPPPSPSPARIPREPRLSTESDSRSSTTSISEYAPSAYPTSTLPAYPDTIRSVSPPLYSDLSRTQTLRSARGSRSTYGERCWSTNSIPSMPSPYIHQG